MSTSIPYIYDCEECAEKQKGPLFASQQWDWKVVGEPGLFSLQYTRCGKTIWICFRCHQRSTPNAWPSEVLLELVRQANRDYHTEIEL